jgi:integrase
MFIFAALFNQTFTAMAKPGFFLKSTKATNPTLIFLIYKLPQGKNFKYSTGESVHPDYWDKATQRAKTNLRGNPAQLIRNKETNMQLERHNLKFTEILAGIKAANEQPTVEKLRDLMDREFLKDTHPRRMEEAAKRPTLLTFIEKWIEAVKFTREQPPKPISELTKKSYRTTLRSLKDFADQNRKGKLDFDDIDMDFYYDYIEFLQTPVEEVVNDKKNEKYGLATNTIGKHIKNIKLFMGEAVEKNLTDNTIHTNKKFKKTVEDVDQIYLTETELDLIYNLDLSKKKRLEAVRDLFIIGCYTALRFSDFNTLKPENIIETSTGGRAIKIKTHKSPTMVVIPLHQRVEEILAKYENNLPRALTNQKMNDYLKEIGELAKINSAWEINKTKAGKRYSVTVPKWRKIVTHTARRSAATNMYLAGIPAISIMKLTGHKTEKSFLTYLRISNEENANLLMTHEFFRPKLKVV